MSKKMILIVAGLILIIPLWFFAMAWIIMWGWNILANYFGFQEITYIIAIVINVFIWLVYGTFSQVKK